MPGPGAARAGMAADLLVAFPGLRDAARAAGRPVVEAMLPPQAFGAGADRQASALAAAAAPAVALAGAVVAGALASVGVVPDHVVEAAVVEERVGELHAAGVRIFVEAGPGDALTRVVGRVLDGRPHVAVAVDVAGEHGITGWLHALARLAVAGVPVDLAALHAGRDSRPDRWTDPPRPPGWVVNGHFVRTAAGDPLPKGLRPAHAAPTLRLGNGHAPAPPADAPPASLSDGELAAVTEYLRILQGMVAAGSEIVRHAAAAEDRA